MIEISLRYTGQLRCEAIHGPSDSRIATDAPTDNHGRGETFSPTDLCATSLGACMMTIMGIVAQGHDLDLAGTTFVVRKHMTPAATRRIAKIEVEFDLPLPETLPQREALEQAAHTCPVALSLHPEIEKVVTFRWNG